MKFLLTYSDRLEAHRRGFAPAGTIVQFTTLEALQGFANASGVGQVIVHAAGHTPDWMSWYDIQDPEERLENHIVLALPPDWERMTWIEVYNGYRE